MERTLVLLLLDDNKPRSSLLLQLRGVIIIMVCYHPLTAYRRPDGSLTFDLKENSGLKPLNISCGQCIGCRLKKSYEWGLRCMYESLEWSECSFITLTYNDENLPADRQLCKQHHQQFIQNLRNRYRGREIRYFMCGEYGSEHGRPHYHFIIFNYFPKDCVFLSQNRRGDKYYNSQEVLECWNNRGFVFVSNVSQKSCAYVARYSAKKLYDVKHDVEPYLAMSRRRGIGFNWLYDNLDQLMLRGHVIFENAKRMIPRGFLNHLKKTCNSDFFESLKKVIKKSLQDYKPDFDSISLARKEAYAYLQMWKKRGKINLGYSYLKSNSYLYSRSVALLC
ncbi:replication initiator protein [Dipodfec virus UOA04_Rod_1048]|nr:replication initiator protein [Dipodfec virus UOA04_Rod_1048]